MTSDADVNPNHDEWVVHICNLLPANELVEDSQNSLGVCVCQVPISLKAAKPEAFIPQFVGLGPYHHHRPDLIMAENLKLGAAMRVLKVQPDVLRQRLMEFVPGSDIRRFYHVDVNSKHEDDRKLLRILIIDSLFLLGLLIHKVATGSSNPQKHSSFLTGKHGMPLVNYAGVELTMDVIIRDVFMLENQIPAHFLKQITQVVVGMGIHPPLDSAMQNFCKKLCPFVETEQLSKNTEEHHHLLDLMYHLTVPESMPEKPDQPQPQPQSHGEDQRGNEPQPLPLSGGEGQPAGNEPQPSPGGEDQRGNQPQPQPLSGGEGQPAGNERNTCCFRCCFICCNILVYLVVICLVVGFIVELILRLLLCMLRPLYRLLAKLSESIGPGVDRLYSSLLDNEERIPGLKTLKPLLGQTKKTIEVLDSTKVGKQDARPAVTIPSVTELHNAGIHFQPAQGGISSVHFDEPTCQFHLPVIKVNVNSEVLFRNLAAYETLTKSEGLFFTRCIEIMRAVIDTPEDVKLLVQNDIIHTRLTDEVVADLFNGMSKSIRPTETPKLEEVIKKVNDKFYGTQTVNRFTQYVYSSWKFLTVVAALVFLVLTAVHTYCSVFGCSPASKSVTVPEDGDYARNNIVMSSM